MKWLRYISLLSILFSLYYCMQPDPGSTIYSGHYDNKAQRIEKLRSLVTLDSDVEDAEYKLYNLNGFESNSTRLPGASYSDYRLAVKLSRQALPRWTSGFNEIELEEPDHSWARDIILHDPERWATESQPRYYMSNDEKTMLIVYEKEGIVFKRIIYD